MLRTKPSLTYSGLTVVLSNQSRFDTVRLLTGGAQHVLNDIALRPELNIMMCDIRVADDKSPWLPNTRCILLLGEYALHTYVPRSRMNVLNEARGTVFEVNGIPAIGSYYPQDCADFKNYEKEFNTGHKSTEEDDIEGDEKALGSTSRSNFSFWLKSDIRKAKWILKNGPPTIEPQPRYITYPNSTELIQVLNGTKGQHLYFDMETDYERQNVQCFSFSFDGNVVYNVPTLDYTYHPAYSALPQIMRALCVAVHDNTIVAHNGSCFDFVVLGYKYRIPVYKCYDTMLAMHRCFPSIEKSLGHCLVGETMIDTVSGKIPIKQLVGRENFHVWSWKNNNPFPAKVKKVFKTRENADIVRVHLWRKTNDGDGMFYEKTFIDCTPDHLFLLNGVWKPADSLVNGDRLTRVRISYGKDYDSYDRIVYKNQHGVDIRERAHKYIYESLYGCVGKDFVHHKDEIKWNNEPDNLKQITESEHSRLHLSLTHSRCDLTSYSKGTFKNGITGQFEILDRDVLEQLYNSGMSQAEIGKLYKTSQASVRLLLKNWGIKIRIPHEGQKLWYAKNKNCTVLGVEYLKEKQDVYCMEVEGTECFSANNVIVHNCTSYWTWQPFHKDQDSRGYRSKEQMMQRMAYCGKDVFTMYLIKQAIDKYAKNVVGLEDSIATAMSQILPYLVTTMQGIRVDEQLRQKKRFENDKLMEQYIRMINILIGEDGIKRVQSCIKGKASSLPSSNKQCVEYFHNILGYPVVQMGKPDKFGGRHPSLAKLALYKLRLKHDNPVIDLCNMYRSVRLETTTPLGFVPWKDDSNKIYYEPNNT